ncbi:SNF2 helicase-associated domain-containing protein [Mycobacterium lepromatosis]|uniref:SNF2 helicase-associated domain-containing protein n=1 Tax=Mycobacterium lepromatosis TaxID=480418 RepID=UPI000B01E877|nr:SNF2 helicase-associated domain-containing protein [Mycobacterium lepromatosis]
MLDKAGLVVLPPSWWDRPRRLRLVLSAYDPVDGVMGKASKFGREQLVEFHWESTVSG